MMHKTPLRKTLRLTFGFRQDALIYAIAGLCIVIELILTAGDQGVIPFPRLRQTVYEYGGFWPGLLGPWEENYPLQSIAMFFSYAFLHGGMLHLVFNVFTLVSLGRSVSARVGQRGLSLVFFGAVFGGALGYGLLTDAPNPMVGASGGLFGLAGAILAWNYVDRFAEQQKLMPVFRAMLALLALNLVLYWLMDGHLAWETHLGGFVAGWIMALIVDPRSQPIDNLPLPEKPHASKPQPPD